MSVSPISSSPTYAKLQAFLEKAAATATTADPTNGTATASGGTASGTAATDSVSLSAAALQALEKSFAMNAIGTSSDDPFLSDGSTSSDNTSSNQSGSLASLLQQNGVSAAGVTPAQAARWSLLQAQQSMFSATTGNDTATTSNPLSTLLSQYGTGMTAKESSALQTALARLKSGGVE